VNGLLNFGKEELIDDGLVISELVLWSEGDVRRVIKRTGHRFLLRGKLTKCHGPREPGSDFSHFVPIDQRGCAVGVNCILCLPSLEKRCSMTNNILEVNHTVTLLG
jgi:hypothetical protein